MQVGFGIRDTDGERIFLTRLQSVGKDKVLRMDIIVTALPIAGIGRGFDDILLGRIALAADHEFEVVGIDERGKAVVAEAEFDLELAAGCKEAAEYSSVQDETVTDTGRSVVIATLRLPDLDDVVVVAQIRPVEGPQVLVGRDALAVLVIADKAGLSAQSDIVGGRAPQEPVRLVCIGTKAQSLKQAMRET